MATAGIQHQFAPRHQAALNREMDCECAMPDFPFTTDGCSGGMTAVWKLIWRRPPPWNDLCVTHDRAYWAGGTVGARRAADRALMAGVTLNGHPLFAFLMWAAVRVGGHPLLPLSWRWGYGYRWPRGYDRRVRQAPE